MRMSATTDVNEKPVLYWHPPELGTFKEPTVAGSITCMLNTFPYF